MEKIINFKAIDLPGLPLADRIIEQIRVGVLHAAKEGRITHLEVLDNPGYISLKIHYGK